MFSLPSVDYVIILAVGLSMLTGLFRGFLKELTALCVWGLAIWLGFSYSDQLNPWLSSVIHDRSLQAVIGFVVIFFGVIIVGALFNRLISLMVHRSGLTGTDRLLGLLFGFIRGVLLVAFVMVVAEVTSFDRGHIARQSVFYQPLTPVTHWLSGFLPHVFALKGQVMRSPK